MHEQARKAQANMAKLGAQRKMPELAAWVRGFDGQSLHLKEESVLYVCM